MDTAEHPQIGFIGQGWIGKHYADDFEQRGLTVVRYSKEEPYTQNATAIAGCDIVFIAVPTPTTPEGFDDGIIRSVIKLVGKGSIAVIKSTILPGTTESIQKENPDIFVLNSPEFLSVSTAAHDASHPNRNIVGIPESTDVYKQKAAIVMAVLAKAPYELICTSKEAETIKYIRNYLGYVRVVAINLFYDLSQNLGLEWDVLRQAIAADPDNGPTYANPVHKTGRGAGGECFIKDFKALINLYQHEVGDPAGLEILHALEKKNNQLLIQSHKDIALLNGVYGSSIPQ